MSHAPSDRLSVRHQTIRNALAERSIDALVVTALPNITFLTNFTGSSGINVVTRERVIFLTDSRYVTVLSALQETEAACPTLDIAVVEGSYDAKLAEVLRELPVSRIGFEAAHLSVSRYHWLRDTLKDAPHRQLMPTDGIVEAARVKKDAYETGVLREAARRLSGVAELSFGEVRAGRRERDIARAIETHMHDAGFTKPAFETIVASGPRAALPHARPSERKLNEGDLVVLDFGGVYDSYCVDLTRTVSVGPAAPRARDVYAAVLAAHDSAIAATSPGRSRFEIDAAARDVLTQAGFGDAFGHGTGHGLGLEVHEEPRIVRRYAQETASRPAAEAVQPGMVFTIEPGAYFPGWGGVRIEDDVLVTDRGVDVLTRVTTELLELGG
jgi:Xaa-Pro aminopeptidase